MHDIDLKDGKFGRPETDGISTPDRRHRARAPATTSERLDRGGAVFEDLYHYFRKKRR